MVGIALSRVLSTAITVVFSPDCVLDIVLPATTVVIVIILKEVSYGISSCYEFYKKKLFIAFCFRRILSMQIILFFLLILISMNFIKELILNIFFLRCIFSWCLFEARSVYLQMLIFSQFHFIIKWIFTFFLIKSSWMRYV